MELDSHHAATYTVARLAGFLHPEARTIAYASQYVDDAVNHGTLRLTHGKTYSYLAPAHVCTVPRSLRELEAICDNLDNRLNAQAWVPFHFLPGNLGLEADQALDAPMIQRLACTPDSPLAAAMCRACMARKDAPNALHRLGLTTHVYADTWTHQGFVGLDTPFNRIQGLVHPSWSLEALEQTVASRAGELLTVGHAMLLAIPDQPFLSWGYTNRDGHLVTRNNPPVFLQAMERVLAFHQAFLGRPQAPMADQDQWAMAEAFAAFTDPDPVQRHERWLDLLATDTFSFGALSPTEMKELRYQATGKGSWLFRALGCQDAWIDEEQRFPWAPFANSDWKLFHDAVAEHQALVMDRLLPAFGLDPSSC